MESFDISLLAIKNNTTTDTKALPTYSRPDSVPILLNSALNSAEIGAITEDDLTISEVIPEPKREELTTKNAVNFLLSGTLTSKVCRYCLEVTNELNSMEKTVEIGSKGGLYSVTIKDMVASFHPFQIQEDPNFPDRICNKCVERTINSYLFTQQCEQTERALRNCFEDIYTKFSKLDPLEGKKQSRGRKKIYVNHNRINADHSKVIDYADPIYHIVNANSDCLTSQPAPISQLECLKCCQTLPNLESLANHSKIHPKSMWYSCRLCGKSFPKLYHLKRHLKGHQKVPNTIEEKFECKTCNEKNEKYYKHIQHLEKHKFKMVFDHLVHRKMNKLCSICLDKGDLVSLDKMVTIHGGPPDLMGTRTMQSVLASTLPELELEESFMGSKICENCVSNAITAYNFKNHTYFVRDRLTTCIRHMLDSLTDISADSNLCIEISKDIIMPIKDDVDETIFEKDEDEMKLEVLEDEYRIKSDEESDETEAKPLKKQDVENNRNKTKVNNGVYINGYKNDVYSEFLAFNSKPKHKIIKKFTCPLCSKHYLSDYFLKRHITKHISQKHRCEPCGTIFGNKFSLLEHDKYAHLLYHSNYNACETCGRGFTKESKLRRHQEQHKNKPCLLCNKVFKTQGFFNAHMQRHKQKLTELKNKYEQSCSFCEKVCSNDNQLSIHVNKVHLQIKPYNCDMCEKQYYTEYNLRFHKKIHSRRSKEKCTFCSKTLSSRKQLVIHIRKHIGVTPHNCQICNESYYSVSRLKKHMSQTHGGTVLCKICKHVSVTKRELKMHVVKVHSVL